VRELRAARRHGGGRRLRACLLRRRGAGRRHRRTCVLCRRGADRCDDRTYGATEAQLASN
jgi:hypothetical protein